MLDADRRYRPWTSAVELIPARLDRPEEPTDHRESNSWTARLADVGPVELLEVLLINATAPFLLIGRLKPLFLRSPFPDRYVMNVAGLDGQFGRAFKTDRHPHVNMSKAALNMITRTSAADYARDGIYMNSVDAGWITHEGAYSARVRMRAQGFVPPLDEVDGAARIYDPIVRGLEGERDFGQILQGLPAHGLVRLATETGKGCDDVETGRRADRAGRVDPGFGPAAEAAGAGLGRFHGATSPDQGPAGRPAAVVGRGRGHAALPGSHRRGGRRGPSRARRDRPAQGHLSGLAAARVR